MSAVGAAGPVAHSILFEILFCDNFQFLFFMFCNVSAFLLIHKHSQSSVLTEFKRLFLVRHRSSCRPIGRVEIWTANQSWEDLLVNWFHPFMSKHWSVVTFHSCKLSKRCWRRLNRSYATSNIYHIIYIIIQNVWAKTITSCWPCQTSTKVLLKGQQFCSLNIFFIFGSTQNLS